MEQLRLEIQSAYAENERIRERYREALVSTTRASLQTSQLSEELEAARQQTSKAERNSVKEARKVQIVLEEKMQLSKRCEHLEKQVEQLQQQISVTQERRASIVSSNANFRIKAVEDPQKSNKHGSMSNNCSKKKKVAVGRVGKPLSLGSAFDDDPEQAEFDFHG